MQWRSLHLDGCVDGRPRERDRGQKHVVWRSEAETSLSLGDGRELYDVVTAQISGMVRFKRRVDGHSLAAL
jgi:hypothetical protein